MDEKTEKKLWRRAIWYGISSTGCIVCGSFAGALGIATSILVLVSFVLAYICFHTTSEAAYAMREADRKSKALRQILNVIGPKAPNCGCQGCQYEMNEAIRLAKEALD